MGFYLGSSSPLTVIVATLSRVNAVFTILGLYIRNKNMTPYILYVDDLYKEVIKVHLDKHIQTRFICMQDQ